MARRGGFPSNKFSNKAKSELYHCLVCLEVCRAPVTCRSGAHLFCFDCLTGSLQHDPRCPVCREPLDSPVHSAFAAAQVSALHVTCAHDQCKWKGTCGEMDDHLEKDCLHEPIKCPDKACAALVPRGEMATHYQFACLQSCPNSKSHARNRSVGSTCDVRLSRHDLAEHLENHCKLRTNHCPHPPCDVCTTHSRMPAHVEICPYAPVPCPRKCGARTFQRQSLDEHRKECPMEPVACFHAPLGCSHVAPRSEIVLHEQDNAFHFSVVRSKVFIEQQQFYQQQISEMKQMFEQKLCVIETKLKEHISMFDSRLAEQTELMGKSFKEQATTLETQQKAQMSLLEKKLDGVVTSLQPLVNKAEAEAEAKVMAAMAEEAAAQRRREAAQKQLQEWEREVYQYNYRDDDD